MQSNSSATVPEILSDTRYGNLRLKIRQ